MATINSIMMRVFLSSRKPSLISSLRSTTLSLFSSFNPITYSGPIFTTCRGFTQPRNTQTCHDHNEDDEDRGTFRGVDFANAVRSVALSQMETALKTLEHDLAKSSTGRACIGHLFQTISIQELEKVIDASPIDMSPRVEGERLLVFIRSLSPKQKHARDTVRNSISKKKEKAGLLIAGLSTDDVKRLEKEVDEMTKKYVKSIEEICNTKLKEIIQGTKRRK